MLGLHTRAHVGANRRTCGAFRVKHGEPFARMLDVLLLIHGGADTIALLVMCGFDQSEVNKYVRHCERRGFVLRTWDGRKHILSLTDAGLSWVLMFEREYEAALARFSGAESGAVV